MDKWHIQQVVNEGDSRSANEWAQSMTDRMDPNSDVEPYRCECSDADCEATVSLSRAEYEAVRANGTTFAIAPNHENPEIDLLVSQNERFAVVEKLPGQAAGIVERSDPRRVRPGDPAVP